MAENTSDIETQERLARADTDERRIRGSFGALGALAFIPVVLLFPDQSMGSGSIGGLLGRQPHSPIPEMAPPGSGRRG